MRVTSNSYSSSTLMRCHTDSTAPSLPPQDHLAAHLVATVMTLPNGTADSCTRVSQPYGARCVPITCPMFTHEK